jgi:hypothetical protein
MTHDRVHSDQFLITQDFFAMMLGVRRTSVTEVAGELKHQKLIDYNRGLDDRFHETGLDGTGSLLVDSSFETERGVVSWQDGVRRSSWR